RRAAGAAHRSARWRPAGDQLARMSWTALLLAGSRPGTDPFAARYGTDLKALIPVGGEPMVRRPATALLHSPNIDRIRVLAQTPKRIAEVLSDDDRLKIERSEGTIASTLDAIFSDPTTQFPLLVTTADHALLDQAMIDDFCAKAVGADVAIGIVERRALMARLPDTERTWLSFRGGAY